jgi:hypothetical protein
MGARVYAVRGEPGGIERQVTPRPGAFFGQ